MASSSALTATPSHCALCFDTLFQEFRLPSCKTTSPADTAAKLRGVREALGPHAAGLFVTLTTTQDDNLRGCIGSLSPIKLWPGISKYTKAAAFEDHRFPRLAPEELRGLTCGVSFLVDFQRAESWSDWQVGEHGLILSISSKHDEDQEEYRATYLPEVAREQGWSRKRTLASLASKAGFRERKVDLEFLSSPRVKLTRYRTSKATLAYEDFARGAY